ncbi:hypothetical protein CJO93_18265 (plasmid) [Ralstonia solanacearum]|nr:hypothetical protein CJO93_00040 [Ralstonia solanacearum]AXW59333.1 hypothetical protein CJO93_18265 [Ralstonia solanacearum]
MFPAKIENLRRNPVCLQRYRHVVARKRQHGLTTTLIYATTPCKVTIKDGKMHLRGYLGISALGQTKVFHRVRG